MLKKEKDQLDQIDKSSTSSIAHRIAVEIEETMYNVFNCTRFGFGGIVNADYIETQPFEVIFAALGYLAGKATPKTEKKIIDIIKKYSYYTNKDKTTIADFIKNEDNVFEIEGKFDNYEDFFNNICDDLREANQLVTNQIEYNN